MIKRKIAFFILALSAFACNVFLVSCDDEEAKARLSRAEREKLRIEDSLAFKCHLSVRPWALTVYWVFES